MSPFCAFFAWFRQNSLLGVALDIPAHFVVGICIYIAMRSKFTREASLLAVAIVALGKEVLDSSMWQVFAYGESSKDIFMTLVGAFLLFKSHIGELFFRDKNPKPFLEL